MTVTRLPLKQLSGVGVSSRYGKKLKLASKNTPGNVFFDDLINMLINVYTHSHTRN